MDTDVPRPVAPPPGPAPRAWIDWRELLLQLIVVFVGLLAALQVDGWKDERQRRKTELVYLGRLHQDLVDYVAWLDTAIPMLEAHRKAVQHVSDSFAAGRILDGDERLFESGIVYVGHLPSISHPSSAYTEMVSSGAFARIDSIELQRAVGKLFATQATMEANFAWWRGPVLETEARMQPYVEYYAGSGVRVPSPEFSADLQGDRVRFDFAQLRSHAEIRNGYYWAADTHADWVEWSTRVRALARDADAIVSRELAARSPAGRRDPADPSVQPGSGR
jgi:hypothetical protein